MLGTLSSPFQQTWAAQLGTLHDLLWPSQALLSPLDLGSFGLLGGLDLYYFPSRQPVPGYLGWEGVCAPDARSWWGMEAPEGEKSLWERSRMTSSPHPRLAKSTLTLIPLLGTHEVIFAFVMDEHARGMLRFIKLFTELSFTSFQVTSHWGSSPAKS